MELKEFLNYFNFDYYFFNNEGEKEIKLIDLAGCNLGDIEKDSFQLSEDGMMAIIERLEIYKHPAENPLLSSGGMNAFNKLKFYCKWQALMNNSIIYT